MQAPQKSKTFRLLDLPPELWVKIGKLVVDDCPTVGSRIFRYHPGRPTAPPQQPNITRVCAALRRELLCYYYRTRIQLQTDAYALNIGRWLHVVGEKNRKGIRGLWLVMWDGDQVFEEQLAKDRWKVDLEVAKVVLHGSMRYHRIKFL